jgi:hypothetical protein
LAEATKQVACQVRTKAENPCHRRAEVEILGVAFCGPCAREQEAYFAIGELADEEAQDFRGEALAEALERMRRVRTGCTNLSLDADTVVLCGFGLEVQRTHSGSLTR